MVACLHGNVDYIKELLQVPGIKIDLRNNKGEHALMCACRQGYIKVAQLILNVVQNPKHLLQIINMQNNDGFSSLMIASHEGHTETVALLLQNGANVNMQTKDGWSSLMIASQSGRTDSTSSKWCIATSICKKKNDGMSSLTTASKNRHTETVVLLLNNSAEVNMQDINALTSLMHASIIATDVKTPSAKIMTQASTNCVQLLIHYGADINLQDNNGITALMLSIMCNIMSTVSLLLKYDAKGCRWIVCSLIVSKFDW